MLTQITDLHREGGLSAEEYRSIKGEIVDQLDTLKRREVEAVQPDDPSQAEIDHDSKEE